ncbi:class I SAM-dependent methyltransferase [Rhodohalobacter sp. SW132]|uniref:methyltransferase n=1 Tax=Rhodohalobacter sp. SW132 TaxID=2293433 RepID=UPI000E245805|nr:class I SAM-dependent methyltransferase [Rhodohalobacter sp. SW132]REL38987.1 class I SAM-dependent methyltransferase [Rhodohalobacter sp. SW132]
MIDHSEDPNPDRPEPVKPGEEPFTVTGSTSPDAVAEKLLQGNYVLIGDKFSSGLKFLSELKKQVFGGADKKDFLAYREKRSQYHLASNRLLVPIRQNKIDLEKAPGIGWLKKLYPDIDDFLLPFPQVQGLNSSWQWYQKGIKYPVLENKLYPYYGTYFPTRFDHLYLFDYWLKKYAGSKSTALDIGTGCGVLAFKLLDRGFETVYATDINQNAITSVRDDAKRVGVEDRLKAWQSDLFQRIRQKTDLIVFNPPWLPGQKETGGLDTAIYYKPILFERFFDEARHHINDDGRIVFLFSNVARITEIEQEHPVESELSKNSRYIKVKLIKRKADRPSSKTKRRDNREGEYVELWELKLV